MHVNQPLHGLLLVFSPICVPLPDASTHPPPVARRVLLSAKQQQRTMWSCWKESFSVPVRASQTLAEKSADAVAARVAVGSRAQDQTAPCVCVDGAVLGMEDRQRPLPQVPSIPNSRLTPHRTALLLLLLLLLLRKRALRTLWPMKVPIQSPVGPSLSIGFPSLLALTRKYPSGVTRLQGVRGRKDEQGTAVGRSVGRLSPTPTAPLQAPSPVVHLHDGPRVPVTHRRLLSLLGLRTGGHRVQRPFLRLEETWPSSYGPSPVPYNATT
jgi:hypothetical protein